MLDRGGDLLKVGAKAPAFLLESSLREPNDLARLEDFTGKAVVLFFYPKDLTPGCTQEACDFRDSFARFKLQGVALIGISKDPVERHRKFAEKYSLPFELLSDTEGKACEAYGVWKEKMLYGRKFMGIERTTFIVSTEGRIAAVFPKVKVKGHVDQVLAALSELP